MRARIRARLLAWTLAWATAYGAIRLAREALAEMNESEGGAS
jgi:hypothetical protein